MSLLVLDPVPSGADEYLSRMSTCFISLYKKSHPDDELVVLNLYDISVPFLTNKAMIISLKSPEDNPVKNWVTQFKKFDKYLVLSPTWNLGIPSILKAYIDLIAVPGETFYYDEQGLPVGLLKEKKMVIMTTAGQSYNSSDDQVFSEMNASYLKQIFTMMGITSIVHFGVEGTKTHPDLVETYLGVLRTQMDRFVASF